MINYFYNIILKTDSCDLYSDVLTSVRKDYYLSKEKQKGKITQNSSTDTVFYEFLIEKDKGVKWKVSDSKSIISDSKSLDEGKSCVSYYGENGLYKSITFSKYHTLLKIEYFNMTKTAEPYCIIEPRKAGNGLCLLLSSRENVKPSVLYPMPDIDDDYILDKIEAEFDEFTVVASTNEGVVRFLSESQLELFEEFVDRATAMKLTDTAPVSFIDENDAVLARKLNPKDFNVKRNLSEILDISDAQEFSYDNIEEELVSDLIIDDESDIETAVVVPVTQPEAFDSSMAENSIIEEIADIPAVTEEPIVSEPELPTIAVEEPMFSTEEIKQETEVIQPDDSAVSVEETLVEESSVEDVSTEDLSVDETQISDVSDEDTEQSAQEQLVDTSFESIDSQDNFKEGILDTPSRIIESASASYQYFGELDDNGCRSGFGRTATLDGRTAYEGEYRENKRNGVGAYYYKDSSLCYYGNWVDNKREGFGIGVSSFDNSIHIGKFSDNKPSTDGVRVDSEGEIKFIRKTLSNSMCVELRFDNDKIIVSKFNENGELVSENISNLMYF